MKTAGKFQTPKLAAVLIVALLFALCASCPVWAVSIGGYNVYYGQLHSHTSISDGWGTPAKAYKYARDTALLDFFSIADHCSYPYTGGMTTKKYNDMKTTANSYNQDGVFTTFWGFEWTSDDPSWGGPPTLLGKGHITIINSPDFCKATDEATNDLNELANWMSTRDCLGFYNHPGEYGYDFDNFTATFTNKICGMELWNRSNNYYVNDPEVGQKWYDEAIGHGWYIGASGSQDNHWGGWGTDNEWRMAVLASSKTRAVIYAAMQARRFYSSRDKNLGLSFKCNSAEMGSQVAAGTLNFQIESTDGDSEICTQVDLLKNGTVIQTWTPNITHPILTTSTTGVAGDYFYVVVYQAMGWVGISAPIYITN